MAITKNIEIGFPVNTNLDNFIYHYKALFDAHGIRNPLPTCQTEYTKLTNAIVEAEEQLLQDFKTVNASLYQMKNEHGDVRIKDMKVAGHRAFISVVLG